MNLRAWRTQRVVVIAVTGPGLVIQNHCDKRKHRR